MELSSFVSHTFCRTPLLPPEGITFLFFLINNRKQGGKVRVGVVQLKRAQDKRDMRAFDAINKGSAFGKGW